MYFLLKKYVKFECSATFPRLIFIIKFLPILKGVVLIQLYSLSKLSKGEDNSITTHKLYKEIDIKYGHEIKIESIFDMKYSEPYKLKEIEKFFLEFYMSRKNINIYHDVNKDLVYFNKDLLRIIEDIYSAYHNEGFDKIINVINFKLYELYLNEPNYEKIKHEALQGSDSSYIENYKNNEEFSYKNSKYLNITRYFILKEIFKDNTENGGIIENTLILSKLSNAVEDESISLSKLSNFSKFDYANDDDKFDYKENFEITFKETNSNFKLSVSPIYQPKKIDDLLDEENTDMNKKELKEIESKSFEKNKVRNNSCIINQYYININNATNKLDKGQNQILKYIYHNVFNESQNDDIPNHISSNEYENI